MKTILINTYDPAGRFDFDDETAELFYQHLEKTAKALGYEIELVCQLHAVDDFSATFVSDEFNSWCPSAKQ